jgi:hypothetical protein
MKTLWRLFLIVVAGLLVMGCGHAGRGVTAPDPTGLPPIPASVGSHLGPVPVVWADSLVDGNGMSAMAGFNPSDRQILLTNRLKRDLRVAWQALEHEKCHVFLWDSGLHYLLPDKLAQAFCDAQATYRVAEKLAR